MKKTFRVFTSIIIISSILIACDKDNDSTEKKNYLKIGETEYVLSGGIIENYGEDVVNTGEYKYEGFMAGFHFVSEGIFISKDANGELNIQGADEIMSGLMYTLNAEGLEDIDYVWSDNSIGEKVIGKFHSTDYCLNWSDDDGDCRRISSGKISVKKSGSEYEITIDCTDEYGKSVTGFYNGTPLYFDYSKK